MFLETRGIGKKMVWRYGGVWVVYLICLFAIAGILLVARFYFFIMLATAGMFLEARGFGKKSNDRRFYLFKIAIPEIDRVYYTEHAVRKPAKLESLQSKLAISVNGDTNEYEWDKDVESFLLWKIDPLSNDSISRPFEITNRVNHRRF